MNRFRVDDANYSNYTFLRAISGRKLDPPRLSKCPMPMWASSKKKLQKLVLVRNIFLEWFRLFGEHTGACFSLQARVAYVRSTRVPPGLIQVLFIQAPQPGARCNVGSVDVGGVGRGLTTP